MDISRRLDRFVVLHALFENEHEAPDVSWSLFIQTKDESVPCGWLCRTSSGVRFGGWNPFLDACKKLQIDSRKIAPLIDSIIEEIDANEAIYEIMTS